MSNDIQITVGAVFRDVINFFSTGEDLKESVLNRPITQIALNTGWLKSKLEEVEAEKEPKFAKNSAFNKNFGITGGTVVEGNDPRLSDARTPKRHDHNINELRIDSTNSGYLYFNGTVFEIKDTSSTQEVLWRDIIGTPIFYNASLDTVVGLRQALATKAPILHPHKIEDVQNLELSLENIHDLIDTKANNLHRHELDEVTGLVAALGSKSNTTHNHEASTLLGMEQYVRGLINSMTPVLKIQRFTETATQDGVLEVPVTLGTVFKVTLNGIDLDSGWTFASGKVSISDTTSGSIAVVYAQTSGMSLYKGVFTTPGNINVPAGVSVWQVTLDGIDLDQFTQTGTSVTISGVEDGSTIIVYGTLGV